MFLVLNDMHMAYLKGQIFQEAYLKPSIWFYGYIGDTFVIRSHEKDTLSNFLNLVKTLNLSTQFTMEAEVDGKIPFSNILATRKHNG